MKSVSTGLENVNIKKTDIFKALKVFFCVKSKVRPGFYILLLKTERASFLGFFAISIIRA